MGWDKKQSYRKTSELDGLHQRCPNRIINSPIKHHPLLHLFSLDGEGTLNNDLILKRVVKELKFLAGITNCTPNNPSNLIAPQHRRLDDP